MAKKQPPKPHKPIEIWGATKEEVEEKVRAALAANPTYVVGMEPTALPKAGWTAMLVWQRAPGRKLGVVAIRSQR